MAIIAPPRACVAGWGTYTCFWCKTNNHKNLLRELMSAAVADLRRTWRASVVHGCGTMARLWSTQGLPLDAPSFDPPHVANARRSATMVR
jgi:hypothetical protein